MQGDIVAHGLCHPVRLSFLTLVLLLLIEQLLFFYTSRALPARVQLAYVRCGGVVNKKNEGW